MAEDLKGIVKAATTAARRGSVPGLEKTFAGLEEHSVKQLAAGLVPEAAKKGHGKALAWLLGKAGNEAGGFLDEALSKAVTAGSSACVRLLLDESAGPNAPTGSIEAFQRAWLVLFQRDEDMPEDGSIAEMLIGAGADPLRRGHLPNESCVVLQAATRMRPAALERLAAITNLPLTEENWLGRTPLAMVISKSGSDRFDLGRSKRCAEALLKAGVPGLETAEAYRKKKRVFWEIKKSEKREALLSFVENWERDEIASVVGQGSDPNETTNKKKRRGL